MAWKYLHKTGPHTWVLDHRLRPEVRAMFLAMSSRMPAGGIEARYRQVVSAVAKNDIRYDSSKFKDPVTLEVDEAAVWRDGLARAEETLTNSIPSSVQEFFDKFVGNYGHSSVMELTGSPAVFVEGVSWWTAWQSFDNPLVSGQEFSTRAKTVKEWPRCFEAYEPKWKPGEREAILQSTAVSTSVAPQTLVPNHRLASLHRRWLEGLASLHRRWLEVYNAEVLWWKEFFSDPKNREEYGIGDKEPFRPAFDKARWALPGTIATGFGHSANLRVMARVIRDAQAVSSGSALDVWNEIEAAYKVALPALANYGLREAVAGKRRVPSTHYVTEDPALALGLPFNGTTIHLHRMCDDVGFFAPPGREKGSKTYIDPRYNHMAQVDVFIRCSLAVARDWHRHRTFYPWKLQVSPGHIHGDYEPKSDVAKAMVPGLLEESAELYREFDADDNQSMAMLALPLGTACKMTATAGLRDFVYTMELRRDAHGANFEYREQARSAMAQLVTLLEVDEADHLGL